MKKILSITTVFAFAGAILFNSGCTLLTHKGNIQPSFVNIQKGDYELSDIKTATGEAQIILGFSVGENDKAGDISVYGEGGIAMPSGCCLASIADPTGVAKSIALYNLMEQNPGYDAVMSPNYKIEMKMPCGLPQLFSTTTATVSARLVKYKK